jgi:hypothetical protein
MPDKLVAEHLPLRLVAAGRIVLRTLDDGRNPGHGGSVGLVNPGRQPILKAATAAM